MSAHVETPVVARSKDAAIRTYTGRLFWPLAPAEEDVDIADIAHALSQACRFTGHTRTFYSVAQHSVIVAMRLHQEYSLEAARYGLLHDASEAYIADVSRPVKHTAEFSIYRAVEQQLQLTIYGHYGLFAPEPSECRIVDQEVLHAELRDLMNGSDPRHAELAAGYPPIVPVGHAEAEALFLRAYLGLFHGRVRL